MAKQTFEEDDGRTIADMSMLSPQSPFGFGRRERRKEAEPEKNASADRPWEQSGMSREDKKSYVWGALSAGLLIALAFIVGLGLLILLIVLIYS